MFEGESRWREAVEIDRVQHQAWSPCPPLLYLSFLYHLFFGNAFAVLFLRPALKNGMKMGVVFIDTRERESIYCKDPWLERFVLRREKEWMRWTCSDKMYIYYCGTTSHRFLLLPPTSSSSSWQLLYTRCFLPQRQTQLVRIMIRSRLPKRGRKRGCRTRSRHWSHTARRWTVCSTHPRVTSICGSKFPKRWRSEATTAPLPCALISGAICWKSTRRPRFKTKAHPKLHASKTWRSFWVSAPSPSHTVTLPNWMHCNKVQMLRSFESCVHPIHVWGWSLDLGSLLLLGRFEKWSGTTVLPDCWIGCRLPWHRSVEVGTDHITNKSHAIIHLWSPLEAKNMLSTWNAP